MAKITVSFGTGKWNKERFRLRMKRKGYDAQSAKKGNSYAVSVEHDDLKALQDEVKNGLDDLDIEPEEIKIE